MLCNFFNVLANIFQLCGLNLKLFKQTGHETRTNKPAHVLYNLSRNLRMCLKAPKKCLLSFSEPNK